MTIHSLCIFLVCHGWVHGATLITVFKQGTRVTCSSLPNLRLAMDGCLEAHESPIPIKPHERVTCDTLWEQCFMFHGCMEAGLAGFLRHVLVTETLLHKSIGGMLRSRPLPATRFGHTALPAEEHGPHLLRRLQRSGAAGRAATRVETPLKREQSVQ